MKVLVYWIYKQIGITVTEPCNVKPMLMLKDMYKDLYLAEPSHEEMVKYINIKSAEYEYELSKLKRAAFTTNQRIRARR